MKVESHTFINGQYSDLVKIGIASLTKHCAEIVINKSALHHIWGQSNHFYKFITERKPRNNIACLEPSPGLIFSLLECD
jgi:hypothetical protein